MIDFEKLGLFYLGRHYDGAANADAPILYDSRDLVTHAMCVGMTGSGKTGLCLALLEEAAIDGVPVIAIDPKGDIANILLTFPRLAPEDFRPWIDEDEARRSGQTPEAFAAAQADLWQKGLAEWGQNGQRIERLRRAADFAIYTPGSRAGLAVSVLSSFAAPPPAVRKDAELLGERAAATASSLLSLAGVEAAPRSREHTLVTSVLTEAWTSGADLDLAGLIRQVQQPGFSKVGVVDLETFFPQKERFDLAMRLNAVLAAPGFEQWFDGAPLDPARLLYTDDGRPRVAVFSIAHLGDEERMFFVSLLLHAIVGWMRTQTGTGSLRSILYMDEIAGYFPPVANPPSKQPLMTLLKQGRAFGVGVVLATQNPVDLDYKALANIGTWFLGRLQTERDKNRVLDGLEGAAGGSLDRATVDKMLSALGKRVFLLHNVHEPAPVVFQTRWTLSYLRGPLSRDQIRSLMSGRTQPASAAASPASPGEAPPRGRTASAAGAGAPPVLPPGIQQFFLPSAAGKEPIYSPVLLGAARVNVTDAKLGVDVSKDVCYAAAIGEGAVAVDWSAADLLDVDPADLSRTAPPGAAFEPLPPPASQPKNYAAWEKAFSRWLTQSEKIELLRHAPSKLTSKPGEAERDFRIRVLEAVRQSRDEAVDALRTKYASKQAQLTERLRRAETAVAREAEQSSQQKLQTAVSFGATLMGALFGRKALSASTLGRATTAARSVGRSMKESSDVARASETVAGVRGDIEAFETKIADETRELAASFDVEPTFDRVAVQPKRGGVQVQFVALGWDPS